MIKHEHDTEFNLPLIILGLKFFSKQLSSNHTIYIE